MKSIINLGEITKPVTKLIESVSSAIGGLYEPTRIRKRARAERDAAIIKAEGDIEIQDMAYRASVRLNNRELKRQKHIEAIIRNAAQQLPEKVSEEKVDDDWISQFFNYCQDVSNEDMQLIWGKLLAGEVSEPGSFSILTLNTVRMLRATDAILFKTLCRYIWNGAFHIVSGETDNYLRTVGIHWSQFLHLESLGLISVKESMLYIKGDKTMTYFDKMYQISCTAETLDRYIPNRVLMNVGIELANIVECEPDEEYLNLCLKLFEENGLQAVEVVRNNE